MLHYTPEVYLPSRKTAIFSIEIRRFIKDQDKNNYQLLKKLQLPSFLFIKIMKGLIWETVFSNSSINFFKIFTGIE